MAVWGILSKEYVLNRDVQVHVQLTILKFATGFKPKTFCVDKPDLIVIIL